MSVIRSIRLTPVFLPNNFALAGVSAATVRFAVGIEGAEDTVADITQALDNL